jgi:hypothetical protein
VTPNLIPLVPQAQQLAITLGTVSYNLVLRWNVPNLCWMMDILDSNNNELLSGVPLVTGADLLEQLEYLQIGGSLGAGQLQAQTTNDTFAVPTYDNLGTTGNLYWLSSP